MTKRTGNRRQEDASPLRSAVADQPVPRALPGPPNQPAPPEQRAQRVRFAQPIDTDGFAPFGQVVSSAGRDGTRINAGTSLRVEMDEPDVLARGGRPSLSVFRATARTLPIRVRELERHRLGSQIFLPLSAAPFIVVVALGASRPDPATLRVFHVDGLRGVTFRRGVWHHPLIALRDGDFAVIERRGAAVDCELAAIEPFDFLIARP